MKDRRAVLEEYILGIFTMKLATVISLILVFPLWLMGCADDATQTESSSNTAPVATNRVVAKDYQVLAASREERQCRHQAARDAVPLFSLERGQKISLLSVNEKAKRVNGDLWLHVYTEYENQEGCFVLADVLAPIGGF